MNVVDASGGPGQPGKPGQPGPAGQIIDVGVAHPIASGGLLAILVISATGSLFVLTRLLSSGRLDFWAGLGATVLTCAGIAWIARWIFFPRFERPRALVAGVAPEELPRWLAEAVRTPVLDAAKLLQTLARQLAADGRCGCTIRLAPLAELSPVNGIDVPFEPEPFGAARGVEEWSGRAPAEVGAGDYQREMRRNMTLWGGWLMVGIFAANALVSGFTAWRDGRISYGAVLWPLAIAAVFAWPIFAGPGARGWLLAPAALVQRRAGWRWGGSRLHLFERRRSVLLVARANAHTWAFAVADGSQAGSSYGTRADVEALLTAWHSPLPPPALERLSDFVAP